ncbi:MAG TPA: hypothetical protein VJY62_09375 [Bacteroidia bacterium]|nr:hypothetical protein [Bacteroidia bacterium]
MKRDLYDLPVNRIIGEGQFNFKLAVDKDETIAIGSCTQPFIFFVNSSGKIADSLKLPFTSCVRNLEFDEYDKLLIMDNEEEHIYKYDRKSRKLEKLPYTKPEDWYALLNHYYKYFEISSVPTFYINKDYLQDSYYTRFNYSYNLWLNYSNGFIYQSAYNFIRKVGNHKTYVSLKKSDLWFSERLSNKSKLLIIDLENEVAVYYNRALILIYEDFKNNHIKEYNCPTYNSEAVQYDFSTNIQQRKIWGVSYYDKQKFTVSVWDLIK